MDASNDLIAAGLEAQSTASAAASAQPTWPESGAINWGQGAGLNEDVLRPDSLDELTDILDRVEFKASIDSDSYVNRSNLKSKIDSTFRLIFRVGNFLGSLLN